MAVGGALCRLSFNTRFAVCSASGPAVVIAQAGGFLKETSVASPSECACCIAFENDASSFQVSWVGWTASQSKSSATQSRPLCAASRREASRFGLFVSRRVPNPNSSDCGVPGMTVEEVEAAWEGLHAVRKINKMLRSFLGKALGMAFSLNLEGFVPRRYLGLQASAVRAGATAGTGTFAPEDVRSPSGGVWNGCCDGVLLEGCSSSCFQKGKFRPALSVARSVPGRESRV